MTAHAPTPERRPEAKAGILDITPYTPGKSTAEGVTAPVKLSANENILGCSEAAREAYLAAAGNLALYPDGRAGGLREAVARRYGLDPCPSYPRLRHQTRIFALLKPGVPRPRR